VRASLLARPGDEVPTDAIPVAMRPITRDTVFGGYRGEAVMIVGVDARAAVVASDAMCEVEYYSEYSPVSQSPVGTRKVVHLNAVEYLYGRGVTSRRRLELH
jgi:hypothetical protein